MIGHAQTLRLKNGDIHRIDNPRWVVGNGYVWLVFFDCAMQEDYMVKKNEIKYFNGQDDMLPISTMKRG